MIALLKRNKYFKVLFYVTLVVVFYLAVIPDDNIHMEWKYADKLKHATAFFTLSFLLNRASSTIQHRLRNMGALLLFGIFIEFVQYFLPERESSILDVWADLAGILLFQLSYSLLKLLLELRNKKL